jgi:hypothetical protein
MAEKRREREVMIAIPPEFRRNHISRTFSAAAFEGAAGGREILA